MVILQQATDIYTGVHKEIYLEYPFHEKTLLIKELADMWLKDIKNIMRPSSYARYKTHMEKYIIPYAGEIQTALFSANTLSKILTTLEKKYFLHASNGKEELLSQYTLYLLESMVRAMCRYGAKKGIMPQVSFGKAEYKIKNKKAAMPLSELEVQQLLSVAVQKEKDYQLQIMLPLYTGMGLSELCGLKWEDICLESGRINIHRNIIRIQQKTQKEQVAENKSNNKNSINSHKIHASKNRNSKTGTTEKSTFKDNPATVFAECELPENECREFVIPEKLQTLLKSVYTAKKPLKESYVAEVDKKSGRKRNVSLVEIVKKENHGTDTARTTLIEAEPPDGRTLQYRLKTAGEMAWIEDLNFQRLKDTFAVMCLQAGGDIYSLAYIMGVSVNAVHDKYKAWMVRDDGFLKGIGQDL